MKLYLAIRNDTDGFTYNSEILLGVCDSQAKADEIILQHQEDSDIDGMGHDLDEYEVIEVELNERLNP